jgi:type II secretory pathway predicted ATPase ExeA
MFQRRMSQMYEKYFGFTKMPFSRDIDVKQLYMHEEFRELKSRLTHAVQHRLFAAVTGEVGSGKTTAIRAMVDELNPSIYKVIYISQSELGPKSFYNEILEQLDITPTYFKPESKRRVNKAVLDMYHSGKTPVIIVDEAHLLSEKMLEEIRFLVNFNMDSMSPLSLILVGQNELSEKLSLNSMRAIYQRITIRYHLQGLDIAGTEDYIRTHLKAVGCSKEIFTQEAINQIHVFSSGIPRKINLVCDKCLLQCYLNDAKLIDDILVKRIIKAELE